MNRIIRFILLLALAAIATPALAGSLTPPGAPSAGSGMPTTAEIYNRLDTGATAAIPGAFQEPAAGPGASGKSLSEIAAKLPVADNVNGGSVSDMRSGKTFWGLRTDGTWGVKTGTMFGFTCSGTLSPLGRWCDQGNGTVKDMTTGFVWLQDAGCAGSKTFDVATSWVSTFSSSNKGSCSTLNDGSTGSWFLPSPLDLKSLLTGTEAVTPGASSYFFSNVQGNSYWSGSSVDTIFAWYVNMGGGFVDFGSKNANAFYVWPVRSGQ